MGIKYFDAHCDTLCELEAQELPMRKNHLHIDLERAGSYDAYAQFFAVYAEDRVCEGLFKRKYAKLQTELSANADIVSFCRTAQDAEKAEQQGKRAAFLSVEGAEVLGCSTERLREAHAAGLRMAALTWNFANAVSGSNAENEQDGLSEHGRAFVRGCERLGVIVDVSHISEKGFWDVAATATKPFIASHSNSSAVFAHRRSLTDAQIKAIAECGGVAGINLYTDFLGDRSIDVILRHIDRFVSVGGESCVAMGGDLDGCERLPNGICGVEDVAKIYDAMIQYGFGKILADRVFWGNLMEVVRKLCVI